MDTSRADVGQSWGLETFRAAGRIMRRDTFSLVSLRMLNGRLRCDGPGQTLMWSVAEIGSGVELAELPVASATTVFEYVTASRNRICPEGQLKVPGPSGPRLRLPVVCSWRTGKGVGGVAIAVGPNDLGTPWGLLPALLSHW